MIRGRGFERRTGRKSQRTQKQEAIDRRKPHCSGPAFDRRHLRVSLVNIATRYSDGVSTRQKEGSRAVPLGGAFILMAGGGVPYFDLGDIRDKSAARFVSWNNDPCETIIAERLSARFVREHDLTTAKKWI